MSPENSLRAAPGRSDTADERPIVPSTRGAWNRSSKAPLMTHLCAITAVLLPDCALATLDQNRVGR